MREALHEGAVEGGAIPWTRGKAGVGRGGERPACQCGEEAPSQLEGILLSLSGVSGTCLNKLSRQQAHTWAYRHLFHLRKKVLPRPPVRLWEGKGNWKVFSVGVSDTASTRWGRQLAHAWAIKYPIQHHSSQRKPPLGLDLIKVLGRGKKKVRLYKTFLAVFKSVCLGQ